MKQVRSLATISAVVLALVLGYFAGRNSSFSVHADSGLYSYLSIQTGQSQSGGKVVIDLRNGNVWDCGLSECTPHGRLPFEQVVAKPK